MGRGTICGDDCVRFFYLLSGDSAPWTDDKGTIRMDLGTVLARKDNVPVSTLLEALQSTLEFESSMSARFHASVRPPRPPSLLVLVFQQHLTILSRLVPTV